jgi:quercetin dioxygenase-like cupin family protein
VKNQDFRIVLTVMKADAFLHEHKTSGRISVQVLSGHIQMHVQDKVFDLRAGHLLALDRAVPHDVKALEDSAFLLTLAWPEEGERHLTK